MKFEHEAPDCTWMADQLMKRSSGFKFELAQNLTLVYLELS
jgi:hypothetical protein